ncbi:MAG: synthase subunit gamma [Rickettsiales bacterium]|jgi:F-type H+-transporting ATPase subunit gamma|nr:synthase subunit gamma [Rickettsiales bacterium]
MPSLKDLKNRIGSVKSTQKITKAMQMVAAAKLRRAQERAKAAEPYAGRMQRMLEALASNIASGDSLPKLLVGTGKDETHLIVVTTSDRGLCGGFNGSIVREARRQIMSLQAQGKKVKLLCLGAKGYDQLKSVYGHLIIERIEGISKKPIAYSDAEGVATKITELLESGAFDVCTVIYNKFQSAISQIVTLQQLIPLQIASSVAEEGATAGTKPVYEFEPDEEKILESLLPRNLAVQLLHALLENSASEQGARMSAMDNATRNAGDMIKKLSLQYNRSRQATITKELIEIISGAEAV